MDKLSNDSVNLFLNGKNDKAIAFSSEAVRALNLTGDTPGVDEKILDKPYGFSGVFAGLL